MVSVTQLCYLGVGVSDTPAWERFATEILGLAVSERLDDGTMLLRMDENHYRIAVHPTGSDTLDYIGWQVSDETALNALADQLTAHGVAVRWGTPEEVARRQVRGLISFTDPNGWASEACYAPRVDAADRFVSPRRLAGFVTGDQGLGHIVVGINDLEESIHFYRDALGMKISDYVQVERSPGMVTNFAFLHCNPRHHSIAFGKPAAPPGRFNHIMLQLEELDDVGSTYDLCEREGIEGLSRLGRHPNDRMVSFYIPTPSGWGFEWGWGARTVDDATWQVQTYTRMSNWGHQRPGRAQPARQPAAVGD